MKHKKRMITNLREELLHWDELFADLSQGQINTSLTPSTFTIKDTMAHLHAWQLISIARLEAARLNQEPVFPDWAGSNPDEEEVDLVNARIYETYREQTWKRVHQDWRDGFLRFLELAEEIPEKVLLDTGKYPWLKGYALQDVLQGSYEHHRIDHFETLLDWLRTHGIIKPAA